MPQSDFCVVSPTDPDPQWPDGYVAVLREAGAKPTTASPCGPFDQMTEGRGRGLRPEKQMGLCLMRKYVNVCE